MSFSDIGRKLGDVLEKESSFAKTKQRKLPPTLRHFQQRERSEGELTRSNEIKECSTRRRTSRGVRPRLNHVCPVTEQPLLQMDSVPDEEASASSSFSFSFDDQDDDSFPAPVSPPLPKQSDSIFASLNKEIINFQKMVTDMEKAMQQSGESPEAQWKTKILIRSSKDAERDISRRLREFKATNSKSRNGRGEMAMRKLGRDFGRVQKLFSTALQSHERRQHVEASLLNVDNEQREEFFDRAIREREEEIGEIHHSMKKVNAIYEDLAGIVDGQQEQIDKLADTVEESKANTRKGMEHFHQAVIGMCGKDEDDAGDAFWPMQDFMEFANSCQEQMVDGAICSAQSMDSR